METVDITHSAGSSGNSHTEAVTRLRRAVDETVGSVFYGTLLKTMRGSSMKGAFGHGGRGEDVFQAQLDQVLVEGAGRARRYDLNTTLFNRFVHAVEVHDIRLQQHDGK